MQKNVISWVLLLGLHGIYGQSDFLEPLKSEETKMKNPLGANCVLNEDLFHKIIDEEPVKIAVFVHGTHRTVGAVAHIPGFSTYVECQKGLNKVDDCLAEYCYARMARSIHKYAPDMFPLEAFYLFAWSGILSHAARVSAANDLHTSLNELACKIGNRLEITLITHSHGGNVALNLAPIVDDRCYAIKALVLLAAPVQNWTEKYVDSDLFQEVYSLYSKWDLIQVGDPQGLYEQTPRRIRKILTQKGQEQLDLEAQIPFFSQRKFASKKVKHVSIYQTGLFGSKRPISHIEFLLPSFSWSIGKILEAAANHDFEQNGELKINLEKRSFWDMITSL